MASWQKPDPSSEFAKLVSRVAELERALRRGKPAPNVRALGDTDTDATAKVTDGQALVYSEATGMWGPGSAGASLPTLNLHATTTSIATGPGTTLAWDDPDNVATHNLGGSFTLTTGNTRIVAAAACMVLATAYIRWTGTAALCLLTMQGTEWAPEQDRRPRDVGANPVTTSLTVIGRLNAGDFLTVQGSHGEAGSEAIGDSFIGVTRLRLL